QGLPGGADRAGAERLLPRREPARAARGRAAPGGRERRGTAAGRARPAAERLLAFVGLDERDERVVRRAWRSAQRLAGELDVLVVVGGPQPSASERER